LFSNIHNIFWPTVKVKPLSQASVSACFYFPQMEVLNAPEILELLTAAKHFSQQHGYDRNLLMSMCFENMLQF